MKEHTVEDAALWFGISTDALVIINFRPSQLRILLCGRLFAIKQD